MTIEQMSFNQALQRLFSTFLFEGVNTALPGIVDKQIDSYRVQVTPAINRKYTDGEELKYKPIVNVPLVLPRTSKAVIRLPQLQQGDTVLLIFSQKAMDSWLNSIKGEQTASSDPRRFDVTDAIAIPGLYPFKVNTPEPKNLNDLEIIYEDSIISMKENGDIQLTSGNVLTIKTTGEIEIGEQSLKKLLNESFKDVFNNHVHNFIAAPSGTFSTSTPASVILTSLPPPFPPGGALATYGSAITNSELTSKVKAQ